jgi:UDP-N-acetylmuramoylalanine--D-glutamate ligase
MISLAGKTAVVVGLGKSGLAAARVLAKEGARVVLNDQKPESELAMAKDARALGVELSLGGHPDTLFQTADVVVLSPGVPPLAPVASAKARGALVIPEVELAAAFVRGTVVGITGSNGKSTVTTLVGEMAMRGAKSGGRPAFVGGNLGDALTLVVGTPAAGENGIVVAELSSFQLEDATELRCHVAACLNVTDDHLDRHGTFAPSAPAATSP